MKLAKTFIAIAVISFFFASFITAEEPTGKDIFVNQKCNVCHAIASQEITSKQAAKYPDLSDFGSKGVEEATLIQYLKKEVKLNEKSHPIKFKGEDAELDVLAKWLLSLKSE